MELMPYASTTVERINVFAKMAFMATGISALVCIGDFEPQQPVDTSNTALINIIHAAFGSWRVKRKNGE